MLAVLLNWIFIAATAFCIGFGITRLVDSTLHYQMKSTDSMIAMGLVVATVYAQVWSLFYKVGLLADIVLLVISVILILVFRKEILAVLQQKLHACTVKKGLFLTIAILLWSYCASRGYMHYDSDLYHAQSIRWIEEYGVVKGLGNIHVRFAYNSSFFALSALYSMPWLFGQSLHCLNGFFALILCVEALRIGKVWERKGLLLSDYARVAALYYLTLVYGEITSPASDYAIMCTVFYIVIKWLAQMEDKEEKTNVVPYALLCVGGAYAVSLKLTAGLILLLAIKPVAMLIRKKHWKSIVIYLILGIVVVAPWLIRTVMISGYLLYPFPKLDIFSVDWKIPAKAAALDAAEIKTWGRGLNDASLVDMAIWEWFPTWFHSTLPAIGKILVILDLICLIAGSVYIVISLCKKRWERLDMLLVWAAVAVSFLFWQVSAPLLRYGYAYVLLLVVLTAGIFLGDIFNRQPVLGRAVCFILLVLGAAKLFSLGNYIIGSSRQPYYVRQRDYNTYELDNFVVEGVIFYYPKEGDRVGYDAFPAIPRKTKFLFRGEDLKDGFRN